MQGRRKPARNGNVFAMQLACTLPCVYAHAAHVHALISKTFTVSACNTSQDASCLYLVLDFVPGGEFFSFLRDYPVRFNARWVVIGSHRAASLQRRQPQCSIVLSRVCTMVMRVCLQLPTQQPWMGHDFDTLPAHISLSEHRCRWLST